MLPFFNRLYQEEHTDGSNSSVKWSCPNIHDLMTILQNIKVELILDNVIDKRLAKLEELSVVQLREECTIRNMSKNGKKVCYPIM